MQLQISNILLGFNSALALLPGVEAQSARSMGFIGCSMAENVAQGYVAVGGTRMWGPYGTGGAVVQSWTDTNSASWQSFDRQAAQNGKPSAVWHAAAGAEIFIMGQPLCNAGQTCFLAGQGGPELTDNLAKRASEDASLNVKYGGTFRLHNGEVADWCHANTAGQQSLGCQAIGFWG
ncbi:hypothetical protein COL922a_008637 [Colletotrichum nupharicola]|nr:hypothetical protein COL922a_008637 [Colletotrichum nupharicola]